MLGVRQMERLAEVAQGRWLAPVSFLLLLIAYHLIFGQFFPTRNGMLGHDYSRILPDLLDGYFWFKSNGVFEPFWFTPAFCGGQPALGAPESGFYSVAQLLTFFVDPLASVYATVLLFASLGFFGFYLLLRACFSSSRQAAVLGAALFMFNGFFIHRMMIGHFAFHGVMLVPWMGYFLLRPPGKAVPDTLVNGAAAGSLLAYCTYSGMVHLLVPSALAVLGIASLHGLTRSPPPGFVRRALVALLVAGGLSAAKLTAALLYLNHFPRSDYTLPGMSSIWNTLQILFSTLFFSPADIAERVLPLIEGLQWALGRQEWEYGVTLIPLLFILAGIAPMLGKVRGIRSRMSSPKWVWIAWLAAVLAIPLALNTYTPGWNAFLKQVPVIKSSIYMMRWFLIFIPLLILVSALSLDGISSRDGVRSGMLVAALVALVLINAVKDRDFYQAQPYPPDAIVNAWRAASTTTTQPRIRSIGAFVNANNEIQVPVDRNDMIARGASQIACYNPIFGYRLEHMPYKSLHLGAVQEETGGLLNIKNPACYTYPEQNNCAPGDHFTVSQLREAQAFAGYQPYPFNFSSGQEIANRITEIMLVLIAALFAVTSFRKIWRA